MFSPAARKPHLAGVTSQRGRSQKDSPSTPIEDAHHSLIAPSVPGRPLTGTPAPWSTRLSVLARFQNVKEANRTDTSKQIEPVYVGEFPQVVRNAQAHLMQKGFDNSCLAGGIDKGTSLSWMICSTQLFIWSYLSDAAVPKNCIVLKIPSTVTDMNFNVMDKPSRSWLVCVVSWDISSRKAFEQCNSAGIILCNRQTGALAYWSDIYSESLHSPIVSLATQRAEESDRSMGLERFNSIIATAIPGNSQECLALACQATGGLWLLKFSLSGIHQEMISSNILNSNFNSSPVNARSLVWDPQHAFSGESGLRFFVLTDHEIQYWNIVLAPSINVQKIWSHEIVGNDSQLGIKKDLAGQKQIWLLDMQLDDRGKEFTILVATSCKDRVSSSNYIQYSLLLMQYNLGFSIKNSSFTNERILEKKALQVVIPKARVEDEGYLFSTRIRVGGKPSGSVVILSGDGTATVTSYHRGSTRLFQFDLPYDGGKVLDASVFPSGEDNDEGAWIVLTEKAGVWAIPEKAILLGAVDPPERSLSRKGSSNERVVDEEKRSQGTRGNTITKKHSYEGWGSSERQQAALVAKTAQDEEAEALLSRLFHEFLSSGEVEDILDNLREKGAFLKEDETNVFTRISKSIIDTLAKHWTTTRGAEFVASSVVSSLLLDKQQKHQKYLHFLTLTKCHQELSSKQRSSMLIIMEHGEKLFSMIQLRELQNILSQSGKHSYDSPSHVEASGSLWTLIQLVGEKARRNTVLLMDRDNMEVFYTKISDIEQLFYCLSQHVEYIVGRDQPFSIQVQHACEVSNACTTLIHAAMHYRDEHKNWYPSLEGLTPWNCQHVVRSGLWKIAFSIMQLLKEVEAIDMPVVSEMWSQLERLTDVLLESYTSAITAKIELGEEHQSLIAEYCSRRDELLACLYELAKRLTQLKYQEAHIGIDDLNRKEAIFREVSEPLLLIAKRHEGYQTLWQLCYDLSDTRLLRSLMHESVGPKGGFSYFVFKQLMTSQQFSKLLRLGEEFQDELAIFLKEHKDLLWLHEIFLNQFSAASETLHAIALSPDDSLHPTSEESPTETKRFLSLADRRRLLNLSKIAAAAGKDMYFEMKARRIEADLQILKLQEEIISYLLDGVDENDIDRPLLPGELVEICLKGGSKELCLKAFDVFAWTSSSFRNSNKSLLEKCWRAAVDQENWTIIQASTAGCGDEVTMESLRETVLYKASQRCYGPESLVYGGSFDEVLPLQKVDAESSSFGDSCSSVEDILKQHKDFPDAGKLMLNAVLLPVIEDNVIVEEDIAMDSR
ncbi:nuclear pore complex protein NUP133 [Curcuma longa]|uniref:nuclear pore complex protein NUP133 n=1 Tax=Curcuma longa TaxID=136217 RepID=UPI003D9DD697